MRKRSHAMENFSHFVVAMIVVLIGLGAVVWALNSFGIGCAVGVPCHSNEAPHPVTYQ